MHLHTAALPVKVNLKTVIDVVDLAEKYMCSDVIHFAARSWLDDPKEADNLVNAITICWRLGWTIYATPIPDSW